MLKAATTRPDTVLAAAFLATAEVLTASQRHNPFAKFSGFRKWTAVLDEQIRLSPHDPDIRFLRLTVQDMSPGFLGYRAHMSEDCRLVEEGLDQGFWSSDAEHEAFVTQIHSGIKACSQ